MFRKFLLGALLVVGLVATAGTANAYWYGYGWHPWGYYGYGYHYHPYYGPRYYGMTPPLYVPHHYYWRRHW